MSDPAPPPEDPFVFTPAPCPRHDGWSADRQRAFIAALAAHGSIGLAARQVGMTPQTARRLRARPEAAEFARAWDAAAEEGRIRACDEALRKGQGELVPLYRRGRLTGVRHRPNNRLLFAACYGEPMSRYERPR